MSFYKGNRDLKRVFDRLSTVIQHTTLPLDVVNDACDKLASARENPILKLTSANLGSFMVDHAKEALKAKALADRAMMRVQSFKSGVEGPVLTTMMVKAKAPGVVDARFTRALAPLKDMVIEFRRINGAVGPERLDNSADFSGAKEKLSNIQNSMKDMARQKYTAGLAGALERLATGQNTNVLFVSCVTALGALKNVLSEEDFTGCFMTDGESELYGQMKKKRLAFLEGFIACMKACQALETVPYGNAKFGDIHVSVHTAAVFLRQMEVDADFFKEASDEWPGDKCRAVLSGARRKIYAVMSRHYTNSIFKWYSNKHSRRLGVMLTALLHTISSRPDGTEAEVVEHAAAAVKAFVGQLQPQDGTAPVQEKNATWHEKWRASAATVLGSTDDFATPIDDNKKKDLMLHPTFEESGTRMSSAKLSTQAGVLLGVFERVASARAKLKALQTACTSKNNGCQRFASFAGAEMPNLVEAVELLNTAARDCFTNEAEGKYVKTLIDTILSECACIFRASVNASLDLAEQQLRTAHTEMQDVYDLEKIVEGTDIIEQRQLLNSIVKSKEATNFKARFKDVWAVQGTPKQVSKKLRSSLGPFEEFHDAWDAFFQGEDMKKFKRLYALLAILNCGVRPLKGGEDRDQVMLPCKNNEVVKEIQKMGDLPIKFAALLDGTLRFDD